MDIQAPGSQGPQGPAATTPNWSVVEQRLKSERQANLPETDTSKALQQFRLTWEAARTTGLERKQTGLIEQQARFSRLKRNPSTETGHG